MLITQESELTLDKEQLKVLASDTRLEILKLLANRNHTVSELATKLSHSKSTIHEHINRLVEAGLIERVNSGYANKWVYYKLTKKGMQLFDRNKRIVVIIASLFMLLAFSQLALLFLHSFYFTELEIMTSKETTQAVRENAFGKESGYKITKGEKTVEPAASPTAAPESEEIQHSKILTSSLQADLFLYGSAACFVIAILLFAYYRASPSRIVLKRRL
ncbi:MAG: winged helix-turn-helix transcriptional regulator [Candidatus Diapherotrites archaeon]|nr:winged helix-turn-helix transcriptional regulator [Candidatus Diapherotrites archaeon]